MKKYDEVVGKVYKTDDLEIFKSLEGNRSVEMSRKYNVKMCVRNSMNDHEGTIVKEGKKMEKMVVKGVAHDLDVARIALVNIDDEPGAAFKVFSLMAKHNVDVDIILQSIGRENKKDISFTVKKSSLDTAKKILEENQETLGYDELKIREDVAKVSIVGAGMVNNPGVAAKMFESLYDAGINIHMISTSEIKVSVLISSANVEKAVNAIHDKFELGK